MLLSFLGGPPTEKMPVVLEQFPDQQKRVYRSDAVGHDAGYVFPVGVSLALDENLVPKCTDLSAVAL